MISMVGTIGVATAANVTVEAPAVDAVSVLVPGAEPSVQLPTVAVPVPFEVVVAPVTDPPPLATVNVTVAPDTMLPFASLTVTAAATGITAPTAEVWLSPADFARIPAGPAIPFAENVKAGSDPALAVSVFAPAADPRLHLPTVAEPTAFVSCVPPVTEPPPVTTVKTTLTPLTGFAFTSFTVTAGAVVTA